MKFLILSLWLIVFTKKLFFWVWLWQLKEYHIGRLRAHFQTKNNRKVIINFLFWLKLILIFGLFLKFTSLQYFLLPIFFIEALFAFKHVLKKTFKFPVLTKKTLLILLSGFILEFFIIIFFFGLENYSFYLYLLALSILTPLIASVLVFVFELVAIVWRRKIIKKAMKKREKFKDLTVIGITGSYGKTSTKEFLAKILSKKFRVLKTKDHQNSEVGVSRCILDELNSEYQIFVCEMGAYNKGGVKLLANIAKPEIGILTGISGQHLATFGSLENIIKTKYELIESLPKDGLAVFNGSNEYCKNLYEKTVISKKLTGVDIWAENVKVEKEKVSFIVSTGKNRKEFVLNLLGKYWIEDILMAAQVAESLEMTLEEISEACREIKAMPGSMRLVRNKDGLNVLDAMYSANFDGVIAHLDYLDVWQGRKLIVMSCLIELGSSSKEIHKRIGERIGKACDLAIITSKDYFDSIRDGAMSVGMKESEILFLEDAHRIFEKIKSFSGKEDIILLESRIPKRLLEYLKFE